MHTPPPTSAGCHRDKTLPAPLQPWLTSSRMRNLTDLRLKPLVFSRWSTSRPGVAITTCGLRARAMACVIMSTPPTTHAVFSPMPVPNASNTSWIWKASSLEISTASRRRTALLQMQAQEEIRR